MINGDFAPLPENLKDATTTARTSSCWSPSGGGRWVSMNTTIKPFDDINVRKAVIAGLDRNALRLTRGGELRRRHRHALSSRPAWPASRRPAA